MPEKINPIGFVIAGGFITALFVLIIEIFLWIKFVPLYNSIMLGVYGAGSITGLMAFKIILLSVIASFILGGFLAWIFAWVYNKIPALKIK